MLSIHGNGGGSTTSILRNFQYRSYTATVGVAGYPSMLNKETT